MRNPNYNPTGLAATIDQEIASMKLALATAERVRDGVLAANGYEIDHAAEHLQWAGEAAQKAGERLLRLQEYTAYPPTPVIMDLGESA